MILFTSITSPLVVQHFAPQLTNGHDEGEKSPLFSRILVPIANPQTQEQLVTLGSVLASGQQGQLLVLNVSSEMNGRVTGQQTQRDILAKVPEMFKDPDVNLKLIPRVDQSYAKGILHTAAERDASMILMGWRGKAALQHSLLGTVLDEVIWGASLPVLVGRLSISINSMQRVVVVIPSQSLPPGSLNRTLEVVVTLSKALNVPALALVGKTYEEKVNRFVNDMETDQPFEVRPVKGNILRNVLAAVDEWDMIVVPSSGSRKHFLASLGDLPERLTQTTAGNVMVLHYPQSAH